ncbi:MAG TPA: hypothetical protein VK589_04545 [Chryseolinea sp.]|nr:hypothetical protein [Chryseolinea sp.]
MIEVFKTDVKDPEDANKLLFEIDTKFTGCIANFDLTDCDRILRIKHPAPIDPAAFIELLDRFGYQAEVLSDNLPH